MTYSKAVNKATKKWVKANKDRITFNAPKGFNLRLKEYAELQGMSKQAFIIATLEKEMEEVK